MKKKPNLLTFEKDTQPTLESSQKNRKSLIFRRRRLTIMFVVAFVSFALMGINLFRNSQHLLSLQKNHQEVKIEYKDVAKTKKELQREVKLLNDDEYVEKLARSKYFYSKEGEQVYSIPELNSSN